MKKYLIVLLCVFLLPSVFAGTLNLYNPAGQVVSGCTMDCAATSFCETNAQISCTQTGWYTAKSPDCADNCPSTGCNIYECQCAFGTCFEDNFCGINGIGQAEQDADGDGFDDRCESFPQDPCSTGALLDNCNNQRGTGCDACLTGTVRNLENEKLSAVQINIIGTNYATTTNQDGYYVIAPINPGNYDISATKNPYTPTILYDQEVKNSEITVINITLAYGSSLCEEDCTYTSDELCRSSCYGTNGCSFYNPETAEICNNQQSGFRISYGTTEEVRCCSGSPYTPIKLKATTEINSNNVVRIVKTAFYEGKLVKVIVDVFD